MLYDMQKVEATTYYKWYPDMALAVQYSLSQFVSY